jgi:competence protein ComEC
MIKTLRQAVFLRLTLFFMVGILIQTHWNFFPYWIYCAFLALFLLVIASFSQWISTYRWRWLFGVGLLFLAASSAGILTYLNWEKSAWTEAGIRNYRVQLIDDPVRKPQTWMCKVKWGEKRLLVYLPVDSFSSTLAPSDWLDLRTRFEKTDLMHLRKQGIAACARMDRNSWEKSKNPQAQGFNVRFYSLKCRRILLNRLKEMLPDEKVFSVAAAILFGYVNELDKDTRAVFAATGSAHILSVSGLHFTIVYGILYFMFGFLGNDRKGQIGKQLIVLPLMWIFAFLTGMGPSVIRAAIMMTLWGIGNGFLFRAFTVNTVGVAAFFMLLYNPFYLFDVGFQLSFSAVLAILWINPYLTALHHSRNPAIRYVWELSCVSTSAQLGTAPLSLYYFHQFPLLYLVSNLFAVPLTGILLFLLPLSLLISFSFGNQSYLLFPVQQLLNFFIHGLKTLAEIPHAVIHNIYLSAENTLILILEIVFFFLLIVKKRIFYVYLLIILVVLQVFHYLCRF